MAQPPIPTPVNNGNLGTTSLLVANGSKPVNGKVYGFQLSLTTGIPQVIDFRSLQNFNFIKQIQGIWVDNSVGTSACSVTMGAQQNFIVPAGYQGLSPAFVNYDTPVFTFSGAGNVTIILTNFPVTLDVHNANITSGSTQTVDMPAFDALIANGGLTTAPLRIDGLGNEYHFYHQNTHIAGNATNTATISLTGTATNTNLSIKDCYVSVDGNAVAGAADTVSASLQIINAGTTLETVLEGSAIIGTTAPTSITGPVQLIRAQDLDLVYLNGTYLANIVITCTGALTAGGIRYYLSGGPLNIL